MKTDNYDKAIKYYKNAIDGGYTLAKFRLGNLYNKKNDMETAKKYYKMAVEDNLIEAKNNLAGLYFEEKDYEKAIKLYEEAIIDGCNEAIENIGDLYYSIGDKQRALSYYLKNFDKLSCQIKIANIYDELENYDEAIIWYKKCVQKNDTHSAYRLGFIYEKLKDYKKSKSYFKIASNKNHINAKIHLGRIYFEDGNYEDAKKIFEAPANEENIYSQHMLGVIYDIYYKDYINSKYWYEKARSKGCIESIYNLGQLSIKLNDIYEAEKYYNEGFKLGNKKCEYMLAGIYLKKSIDMYKSLANEDYEDSIDLLNSIPKININFDEVLIADFKLNEENNDDEEYLSLIHISEPTRPSP